MDSPASPAPAVNSVLHAAYGWWRDTAARDGRMAATGALFAELWDFLRDSTPARRRQRYGDAEYDWDFRVNTTSGAVAWRERLLGVFHSPYQPTEPALFREMLDGLCARISRLADLDNANPGIADFTFIDLGSGKGRTLLMASDYPFRRIVGVELLPALHRIAQDNLRQYKSDSQKCFALEAICDDATAFVFPEGPLLIYLFNPLPVSGLNRVVANLEKTLRTNPRPVYVLYHNPLLEHMLTQGSVLKKIHGTHQYSVFSNEHSTS